MARFKLREVIQDRNGVAQASVSVYVYTVDTTTPVGITLYADKTGGTTKSNPLTTDANGVVECYVDASDANTVGRVDLYCSPGGLGPITLADREFAPDASDLVTKTGTQTLTNKTLTSPVINTPTGDVVSLTGTQTLSNKTLSNPTITDANISGNVYWLGPTRFSVDAGSGTPSQKIAACMALYRATLPSGGATNPGGAEVWFGQRAYALTEPVDFSNLDGLKVMTPGGPGNSTWLYCSGYASPGIMVDLTGTNSCEINGLTVSSTAYISTSAPTNKATVGWLLGSSTRGSNKNRLINCGSIGFFSTSAFMVIGASNLSLQDCAFQQWEAANVIYISGDNAIGADNIAGTLYDAGGSTSDIAFKVVEAHSGGAEGGKTGARNVVTIRGVSNFSWDDGVIDGYDSSSNFFYLTQVSGVYCGNISIKNLRHYKDQSGTVAGTAVYVNDRVDGLFLANNPYQSGISNLIAGPSGMILNRPFVLGDIAAYGFSGTVVAATAGSGGTINGGYIECAGLQLNVGSGAINSTFLANAGTVTATTANWVGTQDARLRAGNGLSVGRIITSGYATALTTGMFGTLTNWGTGATVSAVSGTEQYGTFTITAGSGGSPDPQVTFTYPTPYTTAPRYIVQLSGGTGAGTNPGINMTFGTDNVVMQVFLGTPVNGNTYRFTIIGGG